MVAASLWPFWLEDDVGWELVRASWCRAARKLLLVLRSLTVPFPTQDVGLLEYQHHPRDYASHLSPGSIIQPQRRRPSLLSEFQPGSER